MKIGSKEDMISLNSLRVIAGGKVYSRVIKGRRAITSFPNILIEILLVV